MSDSNSCLQTGPYALSRSAGRFLSLAAQKLHSLPSFLSCLSVDSWSSPLESVACLGTVGQLFSSPGTQDVFLLTPYSIPVRVLYFGCMVLLRPWLNSLFL